MLTIYLHKFFYYFSSIAFIYFFTVNAIQIVLIFLGWIKLKRDPLVLHHDMFRSLLQSNVLPSIAIILPAYNESQDIIRSIKYLLYSEYSLKEIVVVNDGSTDDTLKQIIDTFTFEKVSLSIPANIMSQPVKAVYRSKRFPNIVLLDKMNGGKSDAMNCGINVATADYVCVIDADSLLENDALLKIALPTITAKYKVYALGGVIRIADGTSGKIGRVESIQAPRQIIKLVQIVEYLRAFLLGRLGFSALNALLIISGAYGFFDRETMLILKGFGADQLGEDMELVHRFHEYLREKKKKFSIVLIPETVCWTYVPATIKELSKQRLHWQIGFVQCLMLHKKMFFNPKYRWAGMFTYPYFVIFEALGPFLEVTAYTIIPIGFILGAIDLHHTANLLLVMLWFTVSVSLLSITLEQLLFPRFKRVRDLLLIVWGTVLEVFTYRPLNHVWRTWGVLKYFFTSSWQYNKTPGWHDLEKPHGPIRSVKKYKEE